MKKVIYAVPPINNPKGYATATQNRQFQWLRDPFFAYPIIPAICATMLSRSGKAAVSFVDAVADEMNDVEFGKILFQVHPDYMIFEAMTPLIARYNEIIDGIKKYLPDIKIILCGDHVSAFPDPALYKADHIVTGGDWHYEVYKIITGDEWPKDRIIPHIDRNLTRWWLYAYKNGNFKYLPGTYIMSAMDCWHRKCTFCSWASYHKAYYLRPVEDVLQEIEELIQMGFKEIFDDSGTFPVGEWLQKFCKEFADRGYQDYISFGCNMRFGVLNKEDFDLMKKAGFRMILWGFESANQSTLDRLQKGYSIHDVKVDLAMTRQAGIKSHLTVMFGYYWESYAEAKRTYDITKYMLQKGWADSAQATICIPYPITPLWKECKEKGMLTTEDWNKYDMSQAIMKVPYPEKELFKFQRGIYNMAFHPEFIARKLAGIRDVEDLKYYVRVGRKIYDRFGSFNTIGKPSI